MYRSNRCPNHANNRLSQNRTDAQWYRPENTNGTPLDTASAHSANTAFVPQDTRPAVNVGAQPANLPDILLFEPFSNVAAATSNLEPSTARDAPNPPDPSSFSATNNSAIGTQTTRPQPSSSSRYPYFRRSSMSSHQNQPNYHLTFQNLRPAYEPHASLWHRQQNNQEIHRRYMMNAMSGTNNTNESTPSNSFLSYAGRGTTSMTNNQFCSQCDQQHPIGHPHRRIRPYVCSLNSVSIYKKGNFCF